MYPTFNPAIDADASKSRRLGTLDGSPERFTGFSVDVSAECSDAELARKLITCAERACQVMNTLRQVAPIAISYQGAPIESAEAVA